MIKKHGPYYWLDLRIGGKRIRRSLNTDEHGLAVERARDIERELRAPKPAGVSLEEFIARYLEWARQAKPASARDDEYRSKVIKLWFREAGISSLNAITPWHVEQFRVQLLTRPIGKTGKKTSRTTANRYCALLRAMFNKARDWYEFKGENPVSQVKFFREGPKTRPLSENEVRAVLEAVDELAKQKYATPLQHEAPAFVRFILNTGLRRSEALCLRWTDIGDDALTIKGKGGKVRTIPLNAEAAGILAARKRRGQYVFEIPGRTSDSLMRRLSATITRKTSVPFHLHLLRHVFASRLLRGGVDIVTVSDLLGHGAAMTTLLYTHSSPGQMKRAVDTLLDTGKRIKKRK